MYAKIIEYMEEILDFIQPKDLIYIAIDGVAPMAKMKHQRLQKSNRRKTIVLRALKILTSLHSLQSFTLVPMLKN